MNERMRQRLREEVASERKSKRGRSKYSTQSEQALSLVKDFTLKVRGKSMTFDVATEIDLSGHADDVLASHTNRFAFWKRMLVEAAHHRRKLEQRYDEMRENVYLQYREHFASKNRSATERQLAAEVKCNPKVQGVLDELNDAIYQEEMCGWLCTTFEHRRTVLMKMWKTFD